jgi:hypothetical protein|tara:strand:- start:1731 stop:3566 length:1836 start_codon:yes stop_codon:yes gene_type:complete
MAERLNITELDFDNIKQNLKTYLSKQKEFTDYDFEGSGMAVLLDLLSYNTHYNALYSNMLANEMFLDSADLRNSVVSHAKQIGYTARSARAPKATLNVTVNDATTATVTMARGTAFTTTIDGVSYQYVTNKAVSITPTDGVYTFSNVDVYEGTLVSNKYTVDTTDANQRFLIKNINADTSTLKVTVQTSASDSTTETYTLSTDFTSATDDSKIFFLDAVEDQQYEITFGDGVIGKALSNGNVVNISYVVTNGDASNSATTFASASSIDGFSNITVSVVSNSFGGAPAEENSSIKFNAPKRYSSQNRAVTVDDFKSIVRSIYPNIQSIRVWGGEENDPPVYGRTYISIKAISGSNITQAVKDDITTELKKYMVASVTPVISDPETIFLVVESDVKYDAKVTSKSTDDIKQLVLATLTNYNNNTLKKFDGILRHSNLVKTIDDTDSSILSNSTKYKMYQEVTPVTTKKETYTIKFNNALYHPHDGHMSIVSTTGFKINGDTTNEYFLDDDGSGNVRLYYVADTIKTFANTTQGTIDYTTGEIKINDLYITSVSNINGSTSTVFRLTVQPDSKDIKSVRNQVLEFNLNDATVNVSVDNFAETAGVGYTTTSSNY